MPEFVDAHGIAILYDVFPAARGTRAVVQLLHGVGEHTGRYSPTISALTDAGYGVYAADHRGHGRTGMRQYDGDATKLGQLGPGGLRATNAAIWQLTRTIRDENPGVPVVILGHSGGSFLAQILLNDHPDAVDGLVLTGSALRVPGSLRTGGHNKPWASAADATGYEWLSTDSAIGAAFVADPLTTTRTPMQLFGPIETARIMGRPRRNLGHDIPVLLMVGADDRVGGPRSVHRLADAYRRRSGLTDVTTLVYPGARHELFNETVQDDVRADLVRWLDARFAPVAG